MTPPSSADRVVALDVGGANLKAADGVGWSVSLPFPLWRQPEQLAAALERLVAARRPDRLVATMTGEIADCFLSRSAGVCHIVTALEAAAAACAAELSIYLVDDALQAALATPATARERPLAAAASNWHAVARLAARYAPTERTFLVDVGSTTTDIVPLDAGQPAAVARHDADRLLSGELVYTGVERTPLAALVRSLPHAGQRRPVAAERFADTRDAWLVLGNLPEDRSCCDTADGRPATRDAARVRLARSLLLDPESFSEAAALAAASRCAAVQTRRIAAALVRVAHHCGWRPTGVVLSGHGTWLAARAIDRAGWQTEGVSLTAALGPGVSRSAPAHALACIARGLLP